jgi:hypothetical protein
MVATVLDNSLTGGLLALTASLDAMKAKAEKAAPALAGLVPPGLPKDLDDIIAKSDAWAKESKAVSDAMVELDSAGKGWQGTLATINGDVVEAVKWYLEAGVSQKALATAFGLTDTQVKAVDASLKDLTATEKETDRVLAEFDKEQAARKKEGDTEIRKAAADLTDFQMKQALDTTSYQVMKVWETADAQVKAFKGTADQATAYSAKIYDLAAAQQAAIEDNAYGHMQDLTEKILVDVVAVANKIKGVADDAVSHMAQATSQLQTLQGGVKMPGTSIETAFGQQYLTGPNGQRIAIGPHGELPDNIGDLLAGQSFSSGISNMPRVPGFAEGGVGDFGSGTLAMLHGKEAIVPLGNGGGAAPIVINIAVTQPLGTPAQIADVVGKAIMQNLRQQGMRAPASV